MAQGGKINQRLSGINPLAYLGNDSYQPPEFVSERRPPTAKDRKNFLIGTVWLDTSSYPVDPTVNDIFMLVALSGGAATWVNFGGLSSLMLTGNSGGLVSADINENINVLGDGTTITIVGNPGTNTLTASLVGDVIDTLTGDSGGAVGPTARNIDLVGTGVITVVGNPGTSTLTITPDGSIASSFITNPATGTATPVAGVLTFAGTGGITVTNAGSTVTIDGGGAADISLTADDTNTVTDTAGIINIAGGSNIATTGTVGPNTLTVNLDGITQYSVQVGGASDSLTQITNGTTGQVLTAVTGGDPIWQTNAASFSTGSFTPELAFGGASTGITYSTNTGNYFKINDLIWYTTSWTLTSLGSVTGAATITGLPFTVLNATNPAFESFPCSIGQGHINLDTNYDYFIMRGVANTTTGELVQWGGGQTEIDMDNTNFIVGSQWLIQGWYQED